MANAWDDFWGNLTKPIKGGQGGYSAYGNWDSKKDPLPAMTMGGISNSPINAGQRVGMAASSPAPSRSLQSIKSLNTDRLPGMTEDNSSQPQFANKQLSDEAAYEASGDGPMDKMMARRAQLEAMLDEDYTGDPEMDSLINEAYASALANVGRARGQANENFQKSDANIAALTAGHVNTIKTDDLAAVQRIGGDLQKGYQDTFDTAKGTLEADRTAELEQRTAMLQRLGIQEAGMGTAGQGESDAIARMTERQAGAVKQAQGYQAADEVRNSEQAQSQASAGVERRSALNRDLQGILGKLDESESNINSEKAMAQLQATQSGRKDHLNRLGVISDSISEIDDRIDSRTKDDRDYSLELQKLAQKGSGGSGGVFNAVENSIKNRGVDPTPYTQAYSDVASSSTYNSQVDGDKKLWMIRQMKKKNPGLDAREIQAYVYGVENFGTDKL